MTWELLWEILFFGVMALFVIMAICATVGGASDIKRLLTHLRNPEEDDEEDESID